MGGVFVAGRPVAAVRTGERSDLQLLCQTIHQLLGTTAAPPCSHRGEKLRLPTVRQKVHPVQQPEQTFEKILFHPQVLSCMCMHASSCTVHAFALRILKSPFFQDFASPAFGCQSVDEGRFVCQLCGKGFKAKWNLSQHMPVHTGEKNYVCGCGKKFTQSGSLYKHTKNSCVFRK